MISEEHGQQVLVLGEEDCRNIADALKECISVSWLYLAQVHFRIPRGRIEDIKSDEKKRDDKILSMVSAWQELNGENATLPAVYEILKSADLVGIQQHLQLNYQSVEEKENFNENNERWKEFCGKFIYCKEIHDDELWEKIRLELGFTWTLQEESAQTKEMQRLDFLNIWRERCGYEAASIENLKAALKKSCLRRVIYQLSNGVATSLNPFLLNILEHEWDSLFLKLSGGIFQTIANEFNSSLDKEQVFYQILTEGTDGFFRFMKLLANQFSKEEFYQIFTDETQVLLRVKDEAVCSKDENFYPSGEYEQSKSIFWEKQFLILLGRSGCGKSQLTLALAEDFLAEHPFSVVHLFDCKNPSSIDESIQAFQAALHRSKISKGVRNLVADIKASNIPVLVIFEHLSSNFFKFSELFTLIQEMKKYHNAYALATSTDDDFKSNYFHTISMRGFTEMEARLFLLPGDSCESDEVDAALEVIARHESDGRIPLVIARTKACCQDMTGGLFVTYLEFLNDEDGKQQIERFHNQWMQGLCRDTDKSSKSDMELMEGRVERLESKIGNLETRLSNELERKRVLEQQITEIHAELKVLKEKEKRSEETEQRWRKDKELWERQLLEKDQQHQIELAKKDETISQLQAEIKAIREHLSKSENQQIQRAYTPSSTSNN